MNLPKWNFFRIYVITFLLCITQVNCITEDDISNEINDVEEESETDNNNEYNELEESTEIKEENEVLEEIEEQTFTKEENTTEEQENGNEEENESQAQLTDTEIILGLVNTARAKEGLNTLTLSNTLNLAATLHSQDMQDNDYFSHTGLDGSSFSDRVKSLNYDGSPRSENIAKGYGNPEAVYTGWMNSEGHRNNILTTGITEMGIGRSEKNNYWTQIFAVGK